MISFFALVSTLGVSLGVMVLVVVQSVMNGFGEEIRNQISAAQGDVRIEHRSGILWDWREWESRLAELDEVTAVTPFGQGIVMLQHRNVPDFPFIWGLDPYSGPEVVPMRDFLEQGVGSLDDLDERGVMVSTGLARRLDLRLGSVVQVYTPLMLDRLDEGEIILPRELLVVGIFRTGWHQVDENTAVVSLRLMQDLYGLDDGAHGLALRLRDRDQAPMVAARIQQELPPDHFATSWLETNRDYLFILQLEKTVMFFIIIFIVLVASFSIAISLTMAVVRKTREIGLLGALGARPVEVAASFCLQGLLIGLLGTGIGIGAGLVCLHFRNTIIGWFQGWTQSEQAFQAAYFFAEIPVAYQRQDFVLISGFAVVMSTLAGLVPAWRAARLKPAEALRNE